MSIHDNRLREKLQDGLPTLSALTAETGVANIDALTDSTGGTADDEIADVSTVVGQTANTGSADKTDVDARLDAINTNFKNITDQLLTQRTFNANIEKLIADVAAIRTALVNAGVAV